MVYIVVRIEEDMDFGCEERHTDSRVMAVVALQDEEGNEKVIRYPDRELYELDINEGDRIRIGSDGRICKETGNKTKILITAFEPFGGDDKNASLETMNALDVPADCSLIKLAVPVVFRKAADIVNGAIDREDPDAVICLGQAGGRSCISLEKTAVNLCDTKNADNEGNAPCMEPVVINGPESYRSTLPDERMLEALSRAGISAELSDSAGTYVCNSLMYGVLHYLEQTGRSIPAGFIHVPYYREQADDKPSGTPFMELKDLTRGIGICIECVKERTGHTKKIKKTGTEGPCG